MQTFNFPIKNKRTIIALGAESDGNFSVFYNGKIFYFDNFGDLLKEKNFLKFKKEVLNFIKKKKINPDTITTDLHPSYITTTLGEELANKFKVKHIKVQHHHAHIFSAIGNSIVDSKSQKPKAKSYGIALDGTGYGTDGKIWGGECFAISNFQFPISNQFLNNNKEKEKSNSKNYKLQTANCKLSRIGHLENQTLIGGELAIQEPARIIISVLSKFLSKKEIYPFIKKYYNKNEFELLWNQFQQNFNCIETSSTGRIFDAVSVLLGFSKNERKKKHGPTYLLEKNSALPYNDLKPKIIRVKNKNDLLKNNSNFKIRNSKFILDTTYLFKYLLKYLHRDKKRLAATAQLYVAKGLHEIVNLDLKANTTKKLPACRRDRKANIVLSGGLSENKIIKNYFIFRELVLKEKSLVAHGDKGISFGQIIYYLLKK